MSTLDILGSNMRYTLTTHTYATAKSSVGFLLTIDYLVFELNRGLYKFRLQVYVPI